MSILHLALVLGAQAQTTSALPVQVVLMLPSTWAGQTFAGMTFAPTNQGRTLVLWPCNNCGGGSGGTNISVTVEGVTNLNGLADAIQTFATSTAGTDFTIVSAAGVHTFRLPTASSANRGALSSSDWSLFNSKQAGDPDLTALANISGVQGDILYHDGVTWTKLAAGTSGFKLETRGAGANPVWDTDETGGGGGSGTPGGAFPMLQYNDTGGVFAGTTNYTWDATNSRLALRMSGLRPNSALEMGGSGIVGDHIRAGGSGTGKTNLFDSDGVGQLGNSAQKFYIFGTAVWYMDPLPRFALHPASSNSSDLGTFLEPIGTNWLTRLEGKRNAGSSGYLDTFETMALSLPRKVLPANAHLNGTNQAWTTNLVGNLAVVLTNLSQGVLYTLLVSNPATYTVSFNLTALNWVQFQDGTSPVASTNGWTEYNFLRTGSVTNGWVSGREKPPVAGALMTITETANSMVFAANDQIAPLTINNVANQAALSNAMHLHLHSNLTFTASTGRDQLGGGFSQGTNYVDFDISSVRIMPMTNDMRFAHSTNRCPTGTVCYKKTQYLLFAGETNRIFAWNANWKSIGTTNNPPIMLETNCWMRVDVECWGPNETNVFILAAKQNFPAP